MSGEIDGTGSLSDCRQSKAEPVKPGCAGFSRLSAEFSDRVVERCVGKIAGNVAGPASRVGMAGSLDYLRWHAGDRGVSGNGTQDNRTSGDPRESANLDVAEDLGSGADGRALPDLRMPISRFLAGSAQCHVMQQRDIVIDLGGLTDHQTGGMVQKDAPAQTGCRVDIGLKHLRGAALQVKRQVPLAVVPQPMRQAMRLDGMEALEIEERFKEALAGRIALDHRGNVGSLRLADRRLSGQRAMGGLN